MASLPVSTDELRDLIARGWTPPAAACESFRHLLRPFYDAKGWKSLPASKLDRDDCDNIAALIATFDHFGVEVPAPRPKPIMVPVGTTVIP